MATDAAVARVLAMLHEYFPTREVTEATLDAWAIAFADCSDVDLNTWALAAVREPNRAFFPTPGEILAHRPAPIIDADVLLERISALGTWNPQDGRVYPRVDRVRDALGDAVAVAYGAAGGRLCFADAGRDGSTTTRDIARQKFLAELRAEVKRDPGALLPAAPSRPALGAAPLHLIAGNR